MSPTRRSSSSPIAELGRDDELPLPPDLHPQDSNVPALDDLPGPQLELERLAVLEAVKLLVVGLQSSLTEIIKRSVGRSIVTNRAKFNQIRKKPSLYLHDYQKDLL